MPGLIPNPDDIISRLSATAAPGRTPAPSPASIISKLSASVGSGRTPAPSASSIVSRADVKGA